MVQESLGSSDSNERLREVAPKHLEMLHSVADELGFNVSGDGRIWVDVVGLGKRQPPLPEDFPQFDLTGEQPNDGFPTATVDGLCETIHGDSMFSMAYYPASDGGVGKIYVRVGGRFDIQGRSISFDADAPKSEKISALASLELLILKDEFDDATVDSDE